MTGLIYIKKPNGELLEINEFKETDFEAIDILNNGNLRVRLYNEICNAKSGEVFQIVVDLEE